jgi:HrpA-like RNA helicase
MELKPREIIAMVTDGLMIREIMADPLLKKYR